MSRKPMVLGPGSGHAARRPALGFAVLVGVLLWTGPSEARAQGILGIQKRRGELGFSFRSWANQFGDGPSSLDARYVEWVKLPFSGTVIHPRIFSYSFTLRPALTQGTSSQLAQTIVSRRLDLDFSARLLTSQPVSLTLAGARSAGSTPRAFGASSDFTTSSANALLSLGIAAFPARLSYHDRSTDQTWQADPRLEPIGRSERFRRVRLTGRSSKTSLTLERSSFDDRIGDFDYTSWVGSLGHTFRWGKGSSIASSLDYADRQGGLHPNRRFTWDERVHLQHTREVSSDYYYRQATSRVNGTSGRSRSYGTNLNYRPGYGLAVGIGGRMRSTDIGEVRSSVYSVTPHLAFVAPLPPAVRASAGVAVGYENRREEGVDRDGVPVLNERHTVEATRTFFLDNPDVDLGSVVVRNADETMVYLLDIDYKLIEAAELAQVEIPPTSRIAVGETLLVSYRFLLPASRRGETITLNYHVLLKFAGFTVRHSQSMRGTQSDAPDPALSIPDFNDMSTRLETAQQTPVGRLRVTAERRRRSSERFAHTAYVARVSLALPARSGFQAVFGGSGSRTVSGDLSVNTFSASSSLTWPITPGLRVHGRLEAFTLSRSDAGFEQSIGGSLDISWRFAAMEAMVRFDHQRRNLGSTGTINRLSARAVRRF